MAQRPERGREARSAPPRQVRSARTRAEVLETALALLAEGGPNSVTHRAVAERAGVSLGATTYHFATKADLLEAIHRLHLGRVRKRAESLAVALAARSEEGAPDRERLTAGLVRYLEQGVREDRRGSLATFELALEGARDPALRRRLRREGDRSRSYAVERLAALGARDPEADADLLIALLDGLRLAWLSRGVRSDFAARVPGLVARLVEVVWPE